MRLIIVIYSLEGGGAERVTASIANWFGESGDEVELITITGDEKDAYALSGQVHRYCLVNSRLSGGVVRAIIANVRRILDLRSRIKLRSPDVVLAMMTTASVISVLATIGAKVPIVVSERTNPAVHELGLWWKVLRRITYPFTRAVVVLTKDSLRWLSHEISRANYVVIPNSIEFPMPSVPPVLSPEEYTRDGKKIVLGVGRLDNGKQFDILIEAFFELAEFYPDWNLVIVGDGPLRADLLRRASASSFASRIFLPGRVGNIGDWYSAAEIFVLSSKYEGFPNVLIEAMSYGCAVISYDCDTGPRDIIEHEVSGLLIPPSGGIAALRDSIQRLISDSVLRSRLGEKAISVREKYSRQKIMNEWARVLR